MSAADQQWWLAMEYPLLIYTLSNRISATDNLLLNNQQPNFSNG
jgi:hypothetical protein